jgi:hypothetical protein
MIDPSTFVSVLGDIAAGEAAHRSLSSHNVPRKAFYALVASDLECGNQYARARMSGLECWADEIIELADSAPEDMAATQKAKLQIESRKWLLAKLMPKKYGDHIDLTVTTNSSMGQLGDTDLASIALAKAVTIEGERVE